MIKLSELLHVLKAEEEEGLIPVDNWKATDAMYLEDMGFKNDGIFFYTLKRPEIRLSYKKEQGFIVDDKTNKKKFVVQKFNELENYFANYKQQYENEPYL